MPGIFYFGALLEAQYNQSCQIISFELYLIYGHICRSRCQEPKKINLSTKAESDLPKGTKKLENPKIPVRVISSHHTTDILSTSSKTLLASTGDQSRTETRKPPSWVTTGSILQNYNPSGTDLENSKIGLTIHILIFLYCVGCPLAVS